MNVSQICESDKPKTENFFVNNDLVKQTFKCKVKADHVIIEKQTGKIYYSCNEHINRFVKKAGGHYSIFDIKDYSKKGEE